MFGFVAEARHDAKHDTKPNANMVNGGIRSRNSCRQPKHNVERQPNLRFNNPTPTHRAPMICIIAPLCVLEVGHILYPQRWYMYLMGWDALYAVLLASAASAVEREALFSNLDGHHDAPPAAAAGCYIDNTTGPISYKYAPGNCYPAAPNHGVQFVDNAAQCCTMCQALDNCTFYTYEHGGTVAQPTCYSSDDKACCYLKTAAAFAGRSAGQPNAVSGSTNPIPAPITCRNGSDCGGTNLWTRWGEHGEDRNPPNETCSKTW